MLQLLTGKNTLYVPLLVTPPVHVHYLCVEVKYLVQQQAKIIKRLKLHLAFLIIYFICTNSFFKTKQVSEASCCAMQRLSTEVCLD